MRKVTIRWAGILATLLASSFGLRAMAQETVKETSKAHRFFDSPVDFWRRGIKLAPKETPQGEKGHAGQPERPAPGGDPSDWGFSVKLPSGQTAYQTLPERLVQVLEDPTPEKVQAYFEWRLKRTAKILRAAEAIKEYRQELLGPPARDEASPPSPERPDQVGAPTPLSAKPPQGRSSSSIRLTYFHKKDCPHCDTQDVVLIKWLGRHPDAELQVIEFGERPELWQKHRIRGTPTIVVEDRTGGRPLVLEGLADEKRLDAALAGPRSEPGKGESASMEKEGKP